MYSIKDGHVQVLEGRYYNTHNMQVAIVACITESVDWAAYIGATLDAMTEEDTLIAVARRGAKLTEVDAKHFFPNVDLPYRV